MNNAIYQTIVRRRSVRLFKQQEVSQAIIRKVINAARLAPSAANLQFLEYLAVTNKEIREKIFPHTKWAGYLWPVRVPGLNKRPTFYIVILINKQKTKRADLRDVGASAENILLSLASFGLGACWIGSLEKKPIRKILNIPSGYEIDSLIAGGYPAESPKLEQDAENIKYWLDKKGHLHVPKRPLKNILHFNSLK